MLTTACDQTLCLLFTDLDILRCTPPKNVLKLPLYCLTFQAEIETLRSRIQEVHEFSNDLEIQWAEIQSESKDMMAKTITDAEGREKLLEAKLEDLSDRLRLGMGKLQQAIGESSASVNGKLAHIDVRAKLSTYSLMHT